MIPGIMLAAGASTRFAPAHKLLMPYQNTTIIHHSVDAALASNLSRIIVVTGCQHQRVGAALDELKEHPKLSLIHNPDWNTGRACSLRMGLDQISEQTLGFLAWPADMPCMSVRLINDVISAFEEARQLCFPVYNQRKGHPVAFPSAWREKLLNLNADESGYRLIEQHWDEAIKLERSDVETQLNLNTMADYEQLMRGQHGAT